jgi:hypothetical protein
MAEEESMTNAWTQKIAELEDDNAALRTRNKQLSDDLSETMVKMVDAHNRLRAISDMLAEGRKG